MDQEYPINIPENAQMIRAKDINNDINTIDDDITNKIILCEDTEKPFRIVRPELDFYRKHQLPLPKKHPDVRHEERVMRRKSRNLFLINCSIC